MDAALIDSRSSEWRTMMTKLMAEPRGRAGDRPGRAGGI